MVKICVAKDYTKAPGGRYIKDGPFSGQDFRIRLLFPKFVKAMEKGEPLYIDLDGGFGYPTSFLQEAFGGLALQPRDKRLMDNLVIISEDEPHLIEDIRRYIEQAEYSMTK